MWFLLLSNTTLEAPSIPGRLAVIVSSPRALKGTIKARYSGIECAVGAVISGHYRGKKKCPLIRATR